MLVPARAVIEDANTNSYRVFIIDKENKARLRVVQLAAREVGDTIGILSGIQENGPRRDLEPRAALRRRRGHDREERVGRLNRIDNDCSSCAS